MAFTGELPKTILPEGSEGNLQALTNDTCWVPFWVSTARNLSSDCM
jgi:hypothetical protein